MAITTYKGFIKNKEGDIILPISRGELIFDKSGNCAFHSTVFQINPILVDGKVDVENSLPGLMRPADLKDIEEAKIAIAALKTAVGSQESGSSSLTTDLAALTARVTAAEGKITTNTTDITTIKSSIQSIIDSIGTQSSTDTNTVYGYFEDKIKKALTSALVFKGSISSTQALPTIDSAENGDVYKVAEADTYDGHTECKIGDMFIANKSEDPNKWEYIPAGDDIETALKVKNGDSTTSLVGEITLASGVGISITVNSDTKTITISGDSIEAGIGALISRVDSLENIVGHDVIAPDSDHPSGQEATGLVKDVKQLQGNLGTLEGKVTTAEGKITTLEGKTGTLEGKVSTIEGTLSGAVTTKDDLIAEGNGDKLVKASAVSETVTLLAEHLVECLTVEKATLGTALTEALKGYLAGEITN